MEQLTEPANPTGPAPGVFFIVGTLCVGGAEKLVYEWCRALHLQGLSCTVACLIRREGHYLPLIEEMGIPVLEVRQADHSVVGLTRRLAALVRSSAAQVVHSQCGWSLPQQALASRLGGARAFVLTLHSVYPQQSGLTRLRQKAAGIVAARFIDRAVGVSDAVAAHAAAWTGVAPASVRTIRNGIDLVPYDSCRNQRSSLRAQLGVGERDPLLVCVASLSASKDHATLLRAFGLVLVHWPAARLAIVGDGPLRESIVGLTSKLGISNFVRFLGHRTDVPAVLGASDVFVLSSTREGFALVIAEAGAAGLPVVATKVGGVSEVVRDGETGILVPPGDPSKLAEAIESVLGQEGCGRQMGIAGRRFVVSSFGIDRCISEYLELYRSVMGAK